MVRLWQDNWNALRLDAPWAKSGNPGNQSKIFQSEGRRHWGTVRCEGDKGSCSTL